MFSKQFYLKFLLGLLLMAFAAPPAAQAETADVDGSTTTNAVPLNAMYGDYGYHSQMVYSQSILEAAGLPAGAKITAITFYTASGYNLTTSSGSENNPLTIKLGQPSSSTLSAFITDDLTTVSTTGNIWSGTTSVTLEFDSDKMYTYDGGNLLIDVSWARNPNGYYKSIYWLASSATGASRYANNNSSGVEQSSTTGNYLPKITFTYEAGTDPTIKVDSEIVTINTDPYTAGSATFTVTGTNLTNDINLSVSGSGFAVTPNTIAAANAANGVPVTVTYSAQEAGTFNGTVTLISEGAESKTVTVNANVIQPVISGTVSPTSLNFETYAGVSATGSITVENTGNTAFTPTFSGIAAPFSIEAATEIAAGESKEYTITYAPTAVGSHNGSLTVDINGTTTNVTLNGTASVAPKEVTVAEDGTPISSTNMSPIPVEGSYFDTQGTYGQTIYKKSDLGLLAGKNITKVKYYSSTTFNASKIAGVVLEVYLMETENNGMPIDGLTFSGSAIGEYEIQGGENDIEFNLTEPFNYSGNNNLAVQVRVKTAKSWQNIAWIGKTVASEWISYYKYGSYSGRSTTLPKTTFSYSDSETPTITINPVAVDAFSTEIGTPVTVTVNVTGENLTDDITTAISGDNADCFSATLENGVLTITYNPTAAGNHTATLTLSSTGAQDVTIALNGTATGPAQPYAVTVNPDNGYSFGNVIVNNTKVWTLTVTNNGTESVTPTLSGIEAPFSTNYTAAALAAGQSATLTFTFAPTELGEYSNNITISFPEAGDAIATYTYELTGKGVDESYDPSTENEVVKLVTVDKRSIYEPNFIDNANNNTTPQQLNCYDMRFRMAQPDDPDKKIKAGDLRPGNNLYEFYAIDDFGTEFRFATINLFAEGNPSTSSATALDAPIKVTPSVEYYTEEGMPVHPTYSHYTTLNYTEKIYNDVNELVDLEGVIEYVNDTWSANTATNSHPDHYKFQIRGVGQFGDLVTSLTAEYVESHMTGYGNSLVLPEGWDRGSWVGPNNEIDNVHTYYYYDLYIKRSFFEERGITGPVTVVVNTTLSGSGFNADNYKAMSVNGVEQIIAKEEFKDYSWTVPLGNDLPENSVVEQVPMGVVIRLVSTGADFNRTTGIYIYGGGTGVSNIDTVNIYKSSMNVKAYTQKQVDEDTDRGLVAMNAGAKTDVNVLAYADPAVTGYKLYKNTSASTTGMTADNHVASANHEIGDGVHRYIVNSTGTYNGSYNYVRDESLGDIDGMWLPMYPASENEYYLPVTYANGVGYDGVVRSEGNTYGSAMQQVEKNGSVAFSSSKCWKSEYTWNKGGVEYDIYNPEVDVTPEFPAQTGYELYNYRLWVDYDEDAPAWDFDENLQLTEKMDRPLYSGQDTHIGGQGDGGKNDWAFVASNELTEVKLVARFYYKKTTGSKARPTDRDRLYYVVENQVTIPTNDIVTGIDDVTNKQVAGVKYYNLAGMESDRPFNSVNIIVTRYTDGSISTSKVMR